ncbi:hypothetical protein JW935_23200 [candidate division KSB1 bacterium]|nr:hypothetical protein [candidate division KSB1 bacterium]
MKFYKLFFLLNLAAQISAIAADKKSEISALAPKIFLDCSYCDFDYIRSEINFLNYVIDRKEADIHIMVTHQNTASGGQETTLFFIGRARFVSMDDTLTYTTQHDATDDDVRKKLVKYLKLGLMQYIAKTPVADDLSVNISGSKDVAIKKDNWNNWVFRTRAGGFFREEESTRDISLDGGVSADRITADWKIRLDVDMDYDEESYKIDGKTVKGISREKEFDGMVVKSLSNHWSAGLIVEGESSSYSNLKISMAAYEGVEYNFFPYSESTRRIFRVYYGFGCKYNKYDQLTIYNKTEETLYTQILGSELEYKQPWGRIDISSEASHYFHDISKNNLRVNGDISLHLVKGLSLNLNGGVSMIHDQLALPKGEATDAEILLEVRELETQYSYWFSLGFEYTFGSVFNNIVNPRFGE